MRHVVVVLHGWALHEVGRRSEDGATDATVERDLGTTDGVDDDTGRVGGVPHFELELEVEGNVTEVAALHADIAPLAVLQPRHVVAGADVDVVSAHVADLELAGYGLGLGDLLALETVAVQHVLEVHVSTNVELVGVVNGETAVFEETAEHAVHDCGTDLALDVVTNDWYASGAELLGPLGVGSDEDGDGVDEGHAGVNSGLGVEALRLFGTDGEVGDENVGLAVTQHLDDVTGFGR